ncbi:MAG: 2-phospho-L-lactate guanylyltransferase [Anaerolineae bacterium]|nr:2-phospho-L-lactate guanylyltransferase [Anaerolineae bacterium]
MIPLVSHSDMVTIIPAKPFEQAKSRLSPVLTPSERAGLSQRLLIHTINVARSVGQVVVISRDKHVRQVAKKNGAWAWVEAGSDLNEALEQATGWITAQGVEASLIIPSDLPLLTEAALTEMIGLGQTNPAMVIAPCHRQTGTNALFLRPPKLIEFGFGENSFALHRRLARINGCEPVIYRSEVIGLDLDFPEDLAVLNRLTTLSGYGLRSKV